MRFEWDQRKSRRNLSKHKVAFGTAQQVFADPAAVSILERIVAGEERWWTLGLVEGVVVVVSHTYGEDEGEEVIRIISARKATPGERRIYEQEGAQ